MSSVEYYEHERLRHGETIVVGGISYEVHVVDRERVQLVEQK